MSKLPFSPALARLVVLSLLILTPLLLTDFPGPVSKTAAAPQPEASPAATPLSGNANITVSATPTTDMEVNAQAYRAMEKATQDIACDVYHTAPSARNIVLYQSGDFTAWRNYPVVKATLDMRLNNWKTQYAASNRDAQQAKDKWQKIFEEEKAKAEQVKAEMERAKEQARLESIAAARTRNKRGGRGNRTLASVSLTAAAEATPTPTPTGPGGTSAKALRTLGTLTDLIGGGATVFRAALDFAALLRGETTIEKSSVTMDDGAVQANVLGALRVAYRTQCPDPKFPPIAISQAAHLSVAPNLLAPGIFPPAGDSTPQILNAINDLVTQEGTAQEHISRYNTLEAQRNQWKEDVKTLKAKLEKSEDEAEKAELGEQIAEIEAVLPLLNQTLLEMKPIADRLTQLNTDFAAFKKAFLEPDANGAVGLVNYIKAENLDKMLQDPSTYWLQIKSVMSGGNTRIRKNLVRYISGPDISHSGGTIIEFMLSDRSGNVVLSQTRTVYLKYVGASKIQQ